MAMGKGFDIKAARPYLIGGAVGAVVVVALLVLPPTEQVLTPIVANMRNAIAKKGA